MAKYGRLSTFVLILIFYCINTSNSQVLTPPYFNLAYGRPIIATATCGEGVTEPELFCKLTGANPEHEAVQPHFSVIQGQLCDVCNPISGQQSHPASQAVDGTERWWQSPPLSRGAQFNQVNLTVDLQQEFHVAYVFMKMGNSPRPGVFALEKSTDFGETWSPWQFFADTPSDCENFFGGQYETSITSDHSVICTNEYSKVVPLEGGEIVVSLVNNRPSAQNFSYSETLRDWTKATNIRLRFLRTKTLLGHLMAVARMDPTVTRRYFYSIKDISIGGRCVCNGHADACDLTNLNEPNKLQCQCVHNTCGTSCESCCPGFVAKPWKPATQFTDNACEPCNCNGHTRECHYDEEVAANRQSLDIHGNYEGGGVCDNCQHNTMGINCEQCAPGYYRPYGVLANDSYACQRCRCDETYSTGECEEGSGMCKCKEQFAGRNCDRCNDGYYDYPYCFPCTCNINGTQGDVCEVGGGQCPCKPQYTGYNCDQCAYGYYGFPECKPCECDSVGSTSAYCNPIDGQCQCRRNFGGRDCAGCQNGYYDYPSCQPCDCDPTGSNPEMCEGDTGICLCKPGFGGGMCDRCDIGYFGYPYCTECGCQEPGAQSNDCDDYGQCICQVNYSDKRCDRCAPGYHKYPECLACNCDTYGSYGVTCDETGQCPCRPTFMGLNCDKCRPNYYNYPHCEECNCNPAGAQEVPGFPLGGCGSGITGLLCECKDLVKGHTCDTCKPGYHNLDINNPLGCEDCDCHMPGTVAMTKMCDPADGQCVCKSHSTGRRCEQCRDGFYELQDYNIFGCSDCNCDVGGSLNNNCDKETGKCECRPRVMGRRCSQPLLYHYFPTLYQHQYEMEDGRTPTDGLVRYGFDQNVFPRFSWRGYAIFSRLQKEVLIDVEIEQPTLYRIVFRFVNTNPSTVMADVTLTPDASSDVEQSSKIVFPANVYDPEFITVSSAGIVQTFVLNPGKWTISVKTEDSVFIDYLVLLPQAYYEATILQDRVQRPCTVADPDILCKHFVYVDVSSFSIARGEDGYLDNNGDRQDTQLFPDATITTQLGTDKMAFLDPSQTSMQLGIPVPRPGKYILVIQYHSTLVDKTQMVNVEIQTPDTTEQGKAALQVCPYSSLCRQVVTNANGEPVILNIDGTYASTTITGSDDIEVAIDSVIAVPAEQWDIEIIEPKFKCVRIQQTCIGSTFFNPVGSIRVEFESGSGEESTEIPPNIVDTTVKVIKMDGNAPSVNVKASILERGPYVFIVHYYQPYDMGFDVHVNFSVAGQTNPGKFRAAYCPSVSGCRAVVEYEQLYNGGHAIDVYDIAYVLNVETSSGKPVWLDYVLVVPKDLYNPEVIEILPIDSSGAFINECGDDNFYINPNSGGFCRDSSFSLTTEYNNGAISCGCNTDGSNGFECELFGGQCDCKPNVIGRTCSQCNTGYYGFPDCQECICPSGLCDPVNGQCICPPRVTGDSCNECLPRTFGYDPLIGCEDCNCEPRGVENNDLECNINTGQCSCKVNVGGRACDRCEAGFFSFPYCDPCSCDTKGTTDDVCDQVTAQCLCKENVEGPNCDQCKPSTFYLEDENPKGCTKCFCFGTTNRCDVGTMRKDLVNNLDGWAITNLDLPEITTLFNGLEVNVEQDSVLNEEEAMYWIAPEPYLRNKISTYGGKLKYTVEFELPNDRDSSGLVKPDVRLEGSNLTIIHVSLEQPVAGRPFFSEVDMRETSFVHESTGARVTREQFMMVLAGVEALHIRASYYTIVTRVSLSDIEMDTASPDGFGDIAYNVEQCQCPPNYEGTSCERCAPGYYRARTGPYLGVCVPCQCNGRADTCDPDTGECVNCRDNFGGAQCLSCRQGHYFDERTRRCEMCSCPMRVESNNFATTCQVYPQTGEVFRCECLEGYTGARCDSCDLGYWGNPNEIGGSCQACQCNDNIDVRDPRSCDPYTGACQICINNAAGSNCERCEEWYYGDAVRAKNCQACSCNRGGTESCDNRSGACLCKPNVVGRQCDRCAPGSFGFDRGQGCELCSCSSVGSTNTDCDPYSGQCRCHVGVTGRQCDSCLPGYWNLSPNGCERCQCESDGANSCDPQTGRCECLPGVTGARCDRCLDRWIFLPDQGCQECDSCIHLLLDDLEIMDHNVSTIVGELEHVSVGVGAIRRLDQINETVHQLRPLVDDLIRDPRNGTLDPLWRELEQLKELKDRVWSRAQRTDNEADVVLGDAMKTDGDASDLLILVREATEETNRSVAFAEEVLQDILNSIQNQNVDAIIREAERILDEIKGRDFSLDERAVNDEYGLANETLRRVQELFDRAMDQADEINRIGGKLDGVEDKLRDLLNNSRHSIDNSQAAIDLVKRGEDKKDQIQGDIVSIKELRDDINMMLDMAQKLIDDARAFLDEARAAHLATERESTRLEAAMDDLKDFVDNLSDQNEQLRPLVDRAMQHALDLQKQAEKLASILEDTKLSAGGAVNASKAYQAIVDAINAADDASKAALNSAIEALEFSNGLAERARKSKERSQELKTESQNTKDRVRDELRPRLRDAKRSVNTVERLNQETVEGLTDLLLGLDMLPDGGYGDRAQEAAMKAMDAQQRAEEAANKIEDILDKLPEDQRKINEIPKDIADANRDIQRAQNQVDQVLRLIPDATELIDRLTIQADKVNKIGQDLTFDITALREKIALSREEASRIKVGVTFMKNTTLQLRNPKTLSQAGSYTKISIFFKTSERNGFLAYIGPDRNSERMPTEDFVALEIMDGKVVFRFDLGSGVTTVTNDKEVSDNEWHEAIVERTGKTVSLIVRTEDEDDSVVEGESPGTFSVLDLHPKSSKFYVGGVPENVGLENKLSYLRFVGCIEDVKFDGLPIGMWDFVNGENNHKGCLGRDKLLGAVTNGFRFDGNGVVVLARDRFRPSKASMISLKFKTYADNGLMLLVGEDRDFMSLELHEGKVLFQYDLGSGRAMLESTESYSDGQWHTVVANRLKQDGLVKVDGVTVATGRSPGDLRELSITDDIFIGGHRGQHNYPTVTQQGFDGCIKDVQLGSTLRDINDNTYALGVQPGCPEIARIVSFAQESSSFIAMDPVNVDQNFQATMKVKTLERDGLIFYVADDTQSNSFSVSVVDGRIVVSSNPEGSVTELATDVDTYNDGHWHYITVTKDGRNIRLDIDDTEMVNTRAEGRRRIVTTTPIYFGGVPRGYSIVSSNVGSERTFIGCVGDVTVNGGFVNFALAPPTGREGASLAGCPIADPVTSTVRPTIPLPTIPVDTGEGGSSRDQCKLPLRPEGDGGDSGDSSGKRFGSHPDSRLEYTAAEIPGNARSQSEFSFEFKTTGRDGILFYAYGDRHVDFIAVYLTLGQVNYAFNCGSGTAKMTSPNRYDDGEWHTVVFWRRQARGRLVIDEEEVGEERSGGNQKSINVVSPFYVGGLARDPRETVALASSNMDGITRGFSGCIRNLQLNGIPFGTPTEHHVEPCTSAVESGSFFSADGGYVVLDDEFKVGLDLDITLQIKPRSLSGVIMSVYSIRGDYLVLEMQDGNIIFSVENGGGPIETTHKPPAKNSLCDGGWHTIKAVKAKNVVTIGVDEVYTYPGIGEGGVSSTDTNDPLYIGGVPEFHKGIKTREQFVGCIRNLEFNSRVQTLSAGRVVGQVNLNSCPTN